MKTVPIAQAKIQPVLMILTHPFRGVKNLLITLRCLERYTDLRSSFKKIYILANDSFGEHLLLIQKYVKKYPGLFQDVHCSPPGHNGHVRQRGVNYPAAEVSSVTPPWLKFV